jgi:hypothetical protein
MFPKATLHTLQRGFLSLQEPTDVNTSVNTPAGKMPLIDNLRPGRRFWNLRQSMIPAGFFPRYTK